MALSDCDKCWETPCSCGWKYRNWPYSRLVEMRDIFQKLIDGTHKYSVKKVSSTLDDPLRDYPEDRNIKDGNYLNRCTSCREFFTGHKTRLTCKLCSSKIIS